eukprot:8308380-Alexandrium_andersonii.AAC.1
MLILRPVMRDSAEYARAFLRNSCVLFYRAAARSARRVRRSNGRRIARYSAGQLRAFLRNYRAMFCGIRARYSTE